MNRTVPGRHELLYGNLIARQARGASLWANGHRWPRDTTMTQAIAIALGCPQHLDGKSLLLKTPYTLVTRYRDVCLQLTRKPSLLMTDCAGRRYAGCQGRKMLIILSSAAAFMLQNRPSRQGVLTVQRWQDCLLGQPTAHVIDFKVWSTEGKIMPDNINMGHLEAFVFHLCVIFKKHSRLWTVRSDSFVS